SSVCIFVPPFAMYGICLRRAIKRPTGTTSTNQPICGWFRNLFIIGIKIAAKKGIMIAKVMVNKINPPLLNSDIKMYDKRKPIFAYTYRDCIGKDNPEQKQTNIFQLSLLAKKKCLYTLFSSCLTYSIRNSII